MLEYGGALSGEHGDGLVRSPFMRQMFGDAIYEAFREIKRTFDPFGILNPGKIVDAPELTSNLRFGAEYRAANPKTWFDYSEYGGFAGAVEMCSGVGACRKKLSGTMCPSYMATREESASTRGRANVLRLVMSGQLAESGLGDDGVYRALDLCLECRACKSECPVGVDMARFKSEFLADYLSRHGTPLRAKALGGIHRLSVWGSRFAPVSNWIAGSSAARWLNEKVLDMDRRRRPPAWKHETFERWLTRNPRPNGGAKGSVTLFNDTFVNHYDPEIGIAALKVLERGGYSVHAVRPAGCGRPLISQGLLGEARAQGVEKLPAGLYPIASQLGEKILFCEPSCLSAVRDDAPSLLRGEEQQKAYTVAQACLLFEEFAASLDLPLRAGPGKILVHGHCHQEIHGPAARDDVSPGSHSLRGVGRSGRRLLRNGGFFRVHPRPLRCFHCDCKPPSVARFEGDETRRYARRTGNFLPAPGGGPERFPGGSSGGFDFQPVDLKWGYGESETNRAQQCSGVHSGRELRKLASLSQPES